MYNYCHNFTASTFTIHMINNWCMAFTGLALMLQRMSTKIDILADHQSDEMTLLSYNVRLPIKYAIPCVFSNLGYSTYISLIMSHLEWKVWFYQSLMHYYFVSTLPCSESTKSCMQLKSSQIKLIVTHLRISTSKVFINKMANAATMHHFTLPISCHRYRKQLLEME